jgi:hypothetical protein
MSTYFVKRGDVGSPTPETFLVDGRGEAVDLTAIQGVRFLVRAFSGGFPKVAADAEVIDADTGQVRYTWAEGDLDTPGVFTAEWEVTYAGGAKQTFPADGWISVEVWRDLG